jgi:hypothetical protein
MRLLREDAGGCGTPGKRVDEGDLDVGPAGAARRRDQKQATRGTRTGKA